MEQESFGCMPSPIGRIGIWASSKGLTKLEIGVGPRKHTSAGEKADAHLSKAMSELEKYFAGTLKKFTVATDCSGTKFQEAVWKQIKNLGFGKHASYGDLASAIGNPAGSRAVGGAVGANPVPIIVGCHRVMGSSGAVTGYSGGKGIKTKLWLLEHEGIPYKK